MTGDTKHPKVTVTGRVRGDDGRWIAGAQVSLMSMSANGSHANAAVRTDRNGRFSATVVYFPPYQILVQAKGYGNRFDRTPRILRLGVPNRIEVISLPVANSFLAGRVVDEKGKPLAAQVYGYTTANASAVPMVRTDRQGRFRVEHVLPGDRIGLAVRVADDSCTWDNVPTGRTDVVLVYRAGRGLRYP